MKVPLPALPDKGCADTIKSVLLPLPPELHDALDRAAGRATWDSLPIETQSALLSFVRDGWLGRTRRQRSATIASLCHDGAEAVFAWQAGNWRAGAYTSMVRWVLRR